MAGMDQEHSPDPLLGLVSIEATGFVEPNLDTLHLGSGQVECHTFFFTIQ